MARVVKNCRRWPPSARPLEWCLVRLRQKVVTGTLANMAERVAQADLKSLCLTLIGEVVNLHEALAWFALGRSTPSA